MTPQVTLTLSPSGQIVIERMMAGMRQQIPISDGNLESIVRRILTAQSQRETRLGEDGQPTESQVKCWERHSQFPSYNCPHCLSDGRVGQIRRRQVSAEAAPDGNNKTPIRRLSPGRNAKTLSSNLSADDLGL